MPALLALLPVIAQILMMALKWVAEFMVLNKQKNEFYNSMKEIARLMNLPDLVTKFEKAEEQLKLNENKWDEVERLEKENKGEKK